MFYESSSYLDKVQTEVTVFNLAEENTKFMIQQHRKSLIIGDDYVLSPKDLCTIEFIDQLIEAGIDSFKIEGRKRAPEYVAKTVSVYRKAIDLVL